MNIKPPYLLYLGDGNSPLAIKMSSGLAYWRPELCIGEIRSEASKLTLGLNQISIDQALESGARTLVLGLANSGGLISPNWIPTIIEALEKGLDVAAGMHQKLSDIPEIQKSARNYNRKLHDIRHHHSPLKIGNGQRRSGKRLLTVGTDCSVGKMFTALTIEKEMRAQQYDVDFRATGQTGVIISGAGVCIDAVISDFISGAVEQISPENDEDHWDIIEGQGSLFNPSFAGVSTGLLHGAQADVIVMCHEAGRETVKDLPHYIVPSLEKCIHLNLETARLTNPSVKLGGISLNCRKIGPERGLYEMRELERTFGVPCFDPMHTGVSSLIDIL